MNDVKIKERRCNCVTSSHQCLHAQSLAQVQLPSLQPVPHMHSPPVHLQIALQPQSLAHAQPDPHLHELQLDPQLQLHEPPPEVQLHGSPIVNVS